MSSEAPKEFVSGEEIIFLINLKNETTGLDFDLTDYDELKCCLPAEDSGNVVEITHTLSTGSQVTVNGDVKNGQLKCVFSAQEASGLISVDNVLDVAVEISKSSVSPTQPLRKVITNVLLVNAWPCS